MARPVKVHHIAILCLDPVRLAAFYREAFALDQDTVHRHPDQSVRSVWLRDGSGTLFMFEHASAAGQGAQGWHLVAFSVTPSERATLVQRLAGLGAPEESCTAYSSYFRDPEGNRVAISHHPDLPSAT